MMNRKTTVQLTIFALIAVCGIVYAGGKYAGLGSLFGVHGYRVTADFADAGGIFTNAEVNYRGVPVGRVTGLRLTDDGIAVQFDVDPSAPRIPASTRAVVADRSAVGEQYIDLEPGDGNGPFLGDGSVIPQSRTALPPAPQTVLSDLEGLARSVPTDSMRTVVDELDKAFTGTGPAAQQLLDNTHALVSAADQHVPQTQRLLSDGHTVLDTQEAQTQNLDTFSRGLGQIAQQLKTSDPQLRAVISSAPGAAVAVDSLVRSTGNQLGTLVANLLTTSSLSTSRVSSMRELLVGLPVIAGFSDAVDENGRGRLGVVLNFDDPPPCTRGYEGTQQHAGTDTRPAPPNDNAHCAEPPGSPISVRGAQNAQHGDTPMVTPGAGGQPASQQASQPATPPPGRLGASTDAADLAQLLGMSG